MRELTRRGFMKRAGIGALSVAMGRSVFGGEAGGEKPNIIFCMTDDQGWGDTGYNGHPVLKTPNLDRMAAAGVKFERFYSGAPVCSPTRGSCLTGRHPYRYGIYFANSGHMREEEITLAEVLKGQGYATGHFGKWHLGTLTKTVKESNRGGPRGVEHYSPPWDNGFDVCFSTEAKVPTWDPMKKPVEGASGQGWEYLKSRQESAAYGTHYWTGPDQMATENLDGHDSRVIMDRAIPFVRAAARSGRPFLAVIWFHSPHLPVVAGPEYLDMYKGEQRLHFRNYYGCITAMDEQMGRLRAELARLGVAGSTMLWFCSDNGPEGNAKAPGQTKGLRGRKRSLYEGGVRVPGLLVWPAKIKKARTVSIPCSTSDYFPTVLDVLGHTVPKDKVRPYDGVSLLALIDGRMRNRPRPIAFESRKQLALIDNRYKIYSKDQGETFELYDLIEDPAEQSDLAQDKGEILAEMTATLLRWRASCKGSLEGRDYKQGR